MRYFILILFLCTAEALWSQEMNLESCIDYAWKQSLQVKQAQLNVRQAELNHKQARWAQYPSLSANIRHGVNVGRSVDLTSYQFVNQVMNATNLSLSLNVPLYNGFQIRNSIEQRKVEIEASREDVEQNRNELALSVAQLYLSVLLAEEQETVLQQRMELSKAQLEQTIKLIEVGNLPENNRFDIEAQIAQDEQNSINAQNAIDLAYLNLKIAMNYPLAEDLRISPIATDNLPSAQVLTAQELYNEARSNMPSMRAAQLRERSAALALKVSKGALQPSLSLFSSIGSNYSSLGQRASGDTMVVMQTIQGEIAGQPLTLNIPNVIPARETNPYFSQIKDNFTQAIGVNLQIPILNGLQSRINIERSELSIRIAQMSSEQLRVQLRADVERALADAKAAEKRLAAAQRSLSATRLAVENTRKRYSLGLVNAFELNSVENNLFSIGSNLVQARYEYIFRLKILDFYKGEVLK